MKAYIRDWILEALESQVEPVPASIVSTLIYRKHRERVSTLTIGLYCRQLSFDGYVRRRRGKWGEIYLYERGHHSGGAGENY